MPVCGDKFLNLSPMQTVISLANDNTLTFFGVPQQKLLQAHRPSQLEMIFLNRTPILYIYIYI